MKNKKHNKKNRKLCDQKNGQMIIIMGVVLALIIFVIASLSADIINLNVIISNERATSIVSEFNYIKEAFGTSLNYNLINNVTRQTEEKESFLIFQGDIHGITEAFNQTRDTFYTIELNYSRVFDANLNKYWYSHKSDENHIYHVSVTLSLYDGKTYIAENVVYSILCEPS
ncbi:MAG: hypothetical protein QHH19_00095 [Candidatus Thermoplasmatota archaeon]|jgi:hypothetical protein|nr:hypothetical protein [Candidatus Thermoplasmatota archaeon]